MGVFCLNDIYRKDTLRNVKRNTKIGYCYKTL